MEVYFEGTRQQETLPQYPVECHRKSDYNAGVTAYAHWHYYSELVYVNEGSYDFIVNGVNVTIKEGDVLYINPKQIHTAICPNGCTPCLTVLKFDPSLLKSSIENYTETKYLSPFSLPIFNSKAVFRAVELESTPIADKLDEILTITSEKKFGYEYATHNCICQIIMQFITVTFEKYGEDAFSSCIKERELDELAPAIEYINREFKHEIDTATVVGLCHLSYSNFAMKFKKLTGKSLIEYINFTRISYAQQLLGLTALPITEIATICGFNDLSYFTRTYKKYTGTVGRWRPTAQISPPKVGGKEK